jgi:hypothetical protein
MGKVYSFFLEKVAPVFSQVFSVIAFIMLEIVFPIFIKFAFVYQAWTIFYIDGLIGIEPKTFSSLVIVIFADNIIFFTKSFSTISLFGSSNAGEKNV